VNIRPCCIVVNIWIFYLVGAMREGGHASLTLRLTHHEELLVS